jgi:hypothetical protein
LNPLRAHSDTTGECDRKVDGLKSDRAEHRSKLLHPTSNKPPRILGLNLDPQEDLSVSIGDPGRNHSKTWKLDLKLQTMKALTHTVFSLGTQVGLTGAVIHNFNL